MKYLIPTLMVMLAAASCSHNGHNPEVDHEEYNSVYYWKTVFRLDSAELDFLTKHDIERVYLRMFDVVDEENAPNIETATVPNASVRIDDLEYALLTDSLSRMEFVPVVYVTLDALKAINGHEGVLASNIVTRVKNMCSYNGLPNVSELQLDCDWTASTEASFFRLCHAVKEAIRTSDLNWRLSSTIRLHQLVRPVPPVDRGVLMVYNTGNFNDPDVANSIISLADVEPYLKHLPDYQLHLDVAYPTYSWQLLFSHRQFVGLTNGLNLADTTLFSRRSENSYVARMDIPHNLRIIRQGDIVRQETSSFKELSSVKSLIEKRLTDRPHSNILYHLDSQNLSKYTPDEIDNILSTGL